MAERTFKLPDIGEGIAEAELADWLVRVGDMVQEDDPICEVTTDKATVEIPASATGRVTWLAGSPGEIIAIGGDLIRIETEGAPDSAAAADPVKAPEPARAELADWTAAAETRRTTVAAANGLMAELNN